MKYSELSRVFRDSEITSEKYQLDIPNLFSKKQNCTMFNVIGFKSKWIVPAGYNFEIDWIHSFWDWVSERESTHGAFCKP